jgi:hypothetical protein
LVGHLKWSESRHRTASRGNVNGEPLQGSLGASIASEVGTLRPRKVALCHHDDWMPPLTFPTATEPIKQSSPAVHRASISSRCPIVAPIEFWADAAIPIKYLIDACKLGVSRVAIRAGPFPRNRS